MEEMLVNVAMANTGATQDLIIPQILAQMQAMMTAMQANTGQNAPGRRPRNRNRTTKAIKLGGSEWGCITT